MSKKNDLIVKSNDLINAKYDLSLSEKRVILHMIAKIEKNDEDFQTYQINIKDFADLTQTDTKNIYDVSKNIIKRIMTRVIEIPIENGYFLTHWIGFAEYIEGRGYFLIKFDPALKPYLLKLKEQFTKYNFEDVLKFKSLYSIRIYELLKQYEKIRERVIELDEIKNIFKLTEKYQFYGNIKQRIIEKAQKELKEYSDIFFEYEEIKEGRKVVRIKFFIYKNKKMEVKENINKKEIRLIQDQKIAENNNIYDLLPDKEREKDTIIKLIDFWMTAKDFNYVESNIIYTNKNCKIKEKYRTYLEKSLKEDWGIEVREEMLAIDIIQAKKKAIEEESIKQKADHDSKVVLNDKYEEYKIQKSLEIYQSLNQEEQEKIKVEIDAELTGSLYKQNRSIYELAFQNSLSKILEKQYQDILSFDSFLDLTNKK